MKNRIKSMMPNGITGLERVKERNGTSGSKVETMMAVYSEVTVSCRPQLQGCTAGQGERLGDVIKRNKQKILNGIQCCYSVIFVPYIQPNSSKQVSENRNILLHIIRFIYYIYIYICLSVVCCQLVVSVTS
jgi:hypothetical protein